MIGFRDLPWSALPSAWVARLRTRPARVPTGASPKPITVVHAYYENPRMLRRQLANWRSMGDDGLRVIVVDDGSPDHPATEVLKPKPALDVSLYRIEVDVRWNWLAARNLAMHEAREGWCLLLDMDHMVPPETFRALTLGRHDPRCIYRFSRIDFDGSRLPPHRNIWFMTREMFWRVGGYDEALSGYYGTDGEFIRRAAATAPLRLLKEHVVRHEYLEDSSTLRYRRKQPEDAAVHRLVAARGRHWAPRSLTFPWSLVDLEGASSAAGDQ